MKSVAWLVLSFLLFGFACAQPIPAELDAPALEPVRDTEGHELHAGTEYYILPVFSGRGGGLTMEGINGKENCHIPAVLQEPLDLLPGLPATFTLADPKKGVIRVSSDLNVKFSVPSVCPGLSSVWNITKSDDPNIQWFVTTGGVEGNHGADTVTNWFKIEKSGKYYKLKYCPSICCGFLCRDIGIYYRVDGARILSLSDALEPFLVKFRKVSNSSSI